MAGGSKGTLYTPPKPVRWTRVVRPPAITTDQQEKPDVPTPPVPPTQPGSGAMKIYLRKVPRACLLAGFVLWFVWFLRPFSSKLDLTSIVSGGQDVSPVGQSVEGSVDIASTLVAYQKTLSGSEVNVVPCVTKNSIRGVCATKRLETGDTVVRIPKRIVWSYENLGKGAVGAAFKQLIPVMGRSKLKTYCPLAAYHLLYERDRGARSRWSRDIPLIIASTNDSALLWNDERVMEYGHSLRAAIKEEMREIKETLQVVRPVVVRALPELEKYEFDEYLWAWTKCKSRSWGAELSDEPFMAPGAADLLNHDKLGVVSAVITKNGDFLMTANVPFAEGDEVTFWYGELGRDQQLISYGFLPR